MRAGTMDVVQNRRAPARTPKPKRCDMRGMPPESKRDRDGA
jgi:hypothetical protein